MHVLLYWTGSYILTAFFFSAIYGLLPRGAFHGSGAESEVGVAHFLTMLHFSFVTQSTVGYGDLVPQGWARGVADLQALVGLALNAVLLGAVTTSFLSYHAAIEVPAYLVYEKSKESFWFRYVNPDIDSIVEAQIRVDVFRPVSTKYSIEAARVELDFPDNPTVLTLDLCAIRTRSNEGRHVRDLRATIDDDPLIISPLNLRGLGKIRLFISGRYGATGNGVFFVREYDLESIRCGSHRSLDKVDLINVPLGEIRRMLNREPETTPVNICRQCVFLDQGCPLGLADVVRGSLNDDTPTSSL